jgi:hypothetical protein
MSETQYSFQSIGSRPDFPRGQRKMDSTRYIQGNFCESVPSKTALM